MLKSFKLTDVEKIALVQQNEIKNVVEYDWKNLNMIRLNPTKTLSPGDTNINFQLDTSRLANNYPINRIRMNAKIKVTAKVATNKRYQPPVWGPDTQNYLLTKGANNNSFYNPYLMSPSNGALDAFVLNKMFSNVKIKNGANDLKDDKRSFSKIDMLGRFLHPEKCEKWGIYPDYQKGSYDDKICSTLELVPFKSPTGVNFQSEEPTFAYKTEPQYLNENIFWKRNTNGQYINVLSNNFTYPGYLGNTTAVNPNSANIFSVGSPNYYQEVYKINPQSGDKEYYYQVFPDPAFINVDNISQTIVFDVSEDLISDITTTRYSKNEEFRPLPSSLLSFDFNVSALRNQLYKTANLNIGSITVDIESMSLDIFTFNFGLLSIQPSTYYVPFYQENDVRETLTTVSTTSSTSQITPQTIKFNKMPTYIMIYVEENIASGQNNQINLNTIPIENMTLTIDNDQGASLYGLNKRELEEMSVNNFGNNFANFEAFYRTNSWLSPVEPLIRDILSTTSNNGSLEMTSQEISALKQRYVAPSLPYISGVYLLKIGHDIRIDPMMMPSLSRPTSFNFNITVGKQFAKNATPNNATFHCIAFQPSYYIMNPQTGLLSTKDLSYTEDELLGFISMTNNELKNTEKIPNKQVYNSEHPIMLLGSGWFSNLNSTLKNNRI